MDRLDEPNSAIRTKDLKVRTRLMAVRAVLEPGHSTGNMAAVFDVTARCIRQWVERFNRDGPNGLRDKPKSGRPRAVPAGDIRQAAAELGVRMSWLAGGHEKATGRVLQNDKVQPRLVQVFADTSFVGNNIVASL